MGMLFFLLRDAAKLGCKREKYQVAGRLQTGKLTGSGTACPMETKEKRLQMLASAGGGENGIRTRETL